ncbi:Hydroxyproline-rich glycoprotein family protein, putative isoform 2 [Quillaja saponaria]|uniref:Hydroxyproline-rich glycoprotein family protein, putative isoform 2 n=1 Tax=Quillaja saponaria TaxID=32244 RepID=A0AAD7LWZ4_QUISA|nr:Hydroxyproline-rich glycoprotein family protein, putative isoform 2 [Quillaja saponaria]
MEESEKRRERLKAMRVQADKAEISSSNEGSAVPGCLSNPLIETSPSIPLRGEPGATPRFDFYTDPMSAFSGNKKMSNASSQIAPNYYSPPNFGGPPVQRFHISLSRIYKSTNDFSSPSILPST